MEYPNVHWKAEACCGAVYPVPLGQFQMGSNGIIEAMAGNHWNYCHGKE